MARRLNLEEVRRRLKEVNIELLSDYYKNADTELESICLTCGYEWISNWGVLYKLKMCPKCSVDKKRLGIDEVIKRLSIISPDIEVLSRDYKNNYTPLKLKCRIDGYEWESEFGNLQKGNGCKLCSNRRTGERMKGSIPYNKLTIEIIKERMREIDDTIEILDDTYIDSKTYFKCKCKIDGYEWSSCWNSITQGQRCPKCNNGIIKLTILDVQKMLDDNNKQITVINMTRKNSRYRLTCKCNVCDVEWESYLRGVRDKTGCPGCARKSRGGNSELEQNIRKGVLKQWKKDSMEFYNYKCVITNARFDDIHHLHSFKSILTETLEYLNLPFYKKINEYTNVQLRDIYEKVKDLHYKYGLGVCLTREQHEAFHWEYGYINNSIEQFSQFYNDRTGKILEINKKGEDTYGEQVKHIC